MAEPVRLVAVARGDPRSPLTASGVSHALIGALERRFEIAGAVNCSLRPWQRAATLAASFHPDRARWRERFYRHPLAWELQSRNASGGLPPRGGFDYVVQVFALFQTRGAPCLLDLDTTHELSRRLWPEWSPLSDRQAQRRFALERRAYHDAAHLFARTRAVAESLTGFYGVAPERVTVAGGGVPFPELPREVVGADERDRAILFVGREWRRKGGDLLLEAFRRLRERDPEVVLRIVGTSEPEPEPGVEVLGRIDDRERVRELFARAAVFCLPARYDPFPGAVMEAMAYGTPVVVSDAGGMPDITADGEAGEMVALEPGAIAAALSDLLDDPRRRAQLGAAGRERVKRELNWDAVAGRWATVIEARQTSAA